MKKELRILPFVDCRSSINDIDHYEKEREKELEEEEEQKVQIVFVKEKDDNDDDDDDGNYPSYYYKNLESVSLVPTPVSTCSSPTYSRLNDDHHHCRNMSKTNVFFAENDDDINDDITSAVFDMTLITSTQKKSDTTVAILKSTSSQSSLKYNDPSMIETANMLWSHPTRFQNNPLYSASLVSSHLECCFVDTKMDNDCMIVSPEQYQYTSLVPSINKSSSSNPKKSNVCVLSNRCDENMYWWDILSHYCTATKVKKLSVDMKSYTNTIKDLALDLEYSSTMSDIANNDMVEYLNIQKYFKETIEYSLYSMDNCPQCIAGDDDMEDDDQNEHNRCIHRLKLYKLYDEVIDKLKRLLLIRNRRNHHQSMVDVDFKKTSYANKDVSKISNDDPTTGSTNPVAAIDDASTISSPTQTIQTQEVLSPMSKKEFIKYMTDWLRKNWTHPYNDDEGLQEMANDCNTTVEVISNWLINARTRKWRPALTKAISLNRPADFLYEDSLYIFDKKPIQALTREMLLSYCYPIDEKRSYNNIHHRQLECDKNSATCNISTGTANATTTGSCTATTRLNSKYHHYELDDDPTGTTLYNMETNLLGTSTNRRQRRRGRIRCCRTYNDDVDYYGTTSPPITLPVDHRIAQQRKQPIIKKRKNEDATTTTTTTTTGTTDTTSISSGPPIKRTKKEIS